MGDFSFSKAERILKRSEFKRLSARGKRIYSGHFLIIYRPNHLKRTRLGITVSKNVGCAVTRNRIKRIIREYFRLNKALFQHAYDINIIAKDSVARLSPHETREALESIVHEISVDCKDSRTVVSGNH
nr:ribonuclease P protein component [Desulfobacterales bacterium]